MVRQASDQCCGHPFIIKYIHPLGELQICVENYGFLLMDFREIIKQQLRPGTIVRYISKLIQYHI